MNKIVGIFLCLWVSWSLVPAPPARFSDEAVEKNDEAVRLCAESRGNPDSLKKAIGLLDEAIAIDTAYLLAYSNKAQYLTRLGETAGALHVIRQAQRMDPENPEWYVTAGLLREKLGETAGAGRNYCRALQLYERSLEKNPDNLNTLLNRAFVRLLVDNPEEVVKELRLVAENFQGTSQEKEQLQFTLEMLSSFDRKEFVEKFWKE